VLAFEVHARRLAALKALTSASTSSSEMMEKIYEIVFGILEKVGHSVLIMGCSVTPVLKF